jgi:hypothetical protein
MTGSPMQPELYARSRRLLWFGVTVVTLSLAQVVVTLTYREMAQIRVSSADAQFVSLIAGFGGNLLAGGIAAGITWSVLRRARGGRFSEWLIEASAGPAVVSILSIPLVLILQWSVGVLIITGFVFGTFGFALSGYLTRRSGPR